MEIPNELYSYSYDVEKLYPGCSLGNPEEYVCLDKLSNILSVWCPENEHYLGKLEIDFKIDGQTQKPLTTTFAPAYQYTEYSGEKVNLRKLAFIPYGYGYLRAAYIILLIKNESDFSRVIDIRIRARYSGISSNICCKGIDFEYKEERVEVRQEREKFIARTSSMPYWNGLQGNTNKVRILGSSYMPEKHVYSNPCRSEIFYKVTVDGNSILEFPVFYVVSPYGEKAALEAYEVAKEYNEVFANTVRRLMKALNTCNVITPEPIINRGIFWSKVNMLRVEHRYPLGYGFTNMPPYDILVVRDTSWFTMGNNYFDPAFSQELIKLLATYCQYDNGKMAEYIKLAKFPVTINDYGITLNDCTPLFIIAIYKHYCVTHDEDFLKEYYPRAEKAVEYILAQIKDGLIFSTTPGTSCYGVVGWRNVLSADHINGFVPELNAECVYAIKLTAKLAEKMGYIEKAKNYNKQAELIKENTNKKLVSSKTGFYYLMIDQYGNKREDITADMIIPVMFEIAPPEMQKRIVELLTSPQFWTPFGCRTIGSEQPEYDPEYIEPSGQSLHGGIWPNLAKWVAYAGRKINPGLVAEALKNIYSISEIDDPAKYKSLCPGEFPECLHGDTFASIGMKASPWTPPSYLWLAMEGLAGFEPTINGITVNPSLPSHWKWMAVKDVAYEGKKISLFYWNGQLYSNTSLNSSLPVDVYDEQLDYDTNAPVFVIALRREDETVIFAYAYQDTQCELTLFTCLRSKVINLSLNLKAGEADLIKMKLDPPNFFQ